MNLSNVRRARFLKISDEKLREMYNERFGAPAVQEQGVAKRTQIDEKRTEANLTKVSCEHVTITLMNAK